MPSAAPSRAAIGRPPLNRSPSSASAVCLSIIPMSKDGRLAEAAGFPAGSTSLMHWSFCGRDTDYTLAGTRLDAVVVAFPAVRRRGNPRIAVIAADAAFAVPGVGRHVGGAAQRYAQPRDDRRARRTQLAGRADGGAAAGVRPVPRADWLP